jgi:hypothetical protein
MQVVRKMSRSGRTISLSVRAVFDDIETAVINDLGFNGYRIQTKDGPFVGRDALPLNLLAAFRVQIGKVKNRWSAALVRTTGFTIVDIIVWIFSFILNMILWVIKLFFSRRVRLSRLKKGIVIKSRRIERIKEAEFFIFVSLAAVAKAIEYSRRIGYDDTYSGKDFLTQIAGLDFAGAGESVEGPLDQGANMLAQLEKA